MRSFIFSLAMAVAVTSMAVQTSEAATGDQNKAQAIARSLKQSGRLKDYRVGVKYKDGVAWLTGTVTSERQKQLAEQIARNNPGVSHVISKLEVEGFEAADAFVDNDFEVASKLQPQPRRQAAPRQQIARRNRGNNMPVPYARSGQGVQRTNFSQANYCPDGSCMNGNGGGYAGAGMGGNGMPGATGQSVSYDNPQMPGYAWPSYAASPNYAALTYPKQYSPSAWPYIGPFYPYPQVPLGWRKVTLEWDDGWWFLDFKDNKHCH